MQRNDSPRKRHIVKIAALIAVTSASLALTFALPARAATGMSGMQYYVGTWSCTGGTIGKKPTQATLTYVMNGDVLQQWLRVPHSQTMKVPYVQSSSMTYDSKNDRYVDTGVANDGSWFVNYTTLSGNTETSVDHAVSSGKLGRGVTVRTSSTAFSYTGYPTTSGGKADFKATCQKS